MITDWKKMFKKRKVVIPYSIYEKTKYESKRSWILRNQELCVKILKELEKIG